MTDHITLESLALEISKVITARDDVTKHDPRDSMDMTILETLHKIGHLAEGLPGVRPHILKMVNDGEITVYSTRGALQPVQTSDVSQINFDKWRTSDQDADKVRLKMGIKPPAKPGERESALGGVESDIKPTWGIKTSLERAPGYRWPLYQVIKAAQVAGQPCPKPRDVLDIWTLKPPPDVQVMPDGVKYNDALGNPKEANLKAIGQAIKGLLNKTA